MLRYADINKYAAGIKFDETYDNDDLFDNPVVSVNLETGKKSCRLDELWAKSGCVTYEAGKEPEKKKEKANQLYIKKTVEELLGKKTQDDKYIINEILKHSIDGIAPRVTDKAIRNVYEKAKRRKGWIWYVRAAGLKRPGNTSWTRTEEQELLRLESRYTEEELAKYLGRTIKSIRNKKTRLGINAGKKRRWTKKEEEQLEQMYGKKTYKEMMAELDRNHASISDKIRTMGLRD